MNVLVMAGKEFDDAVRSRSLWVLGAIFAVALAGVTVGYALVTPRPTASTLLVYVIELVKWLVPVTSLVVGYDAVVGERDSGTIRLLFGFPYTRSEVLLGKAVGRYAAVVAPVTAGIVVSFLLSLVLYQRTLPREYALLVVTTAVFVGVFVSLAVALSATSPSTVKVVAMAVAAFVSFLFLWDLVPATAYFVLEGGVPGARTPPAWYFLLERLNPVESFVTVLASAYPTMVSSAPSGGPFYLAGWFAGLMLFGWIVLPLGLAIARFRLVDLA